MKAYRGRWGTAPLNRRLSPRPKWMVNFTPRTLHPPGRTTVPTKLEAGWARVGPDVLDKKKKTLDPAGIGTPDQARSLIAIPTTLPWFARVGSTCTLPFVISMHLVLRCLSVRSTCLSALLTEFRIHAGIRAQKNKAASDAFPSRSAQPLPRLFYFQNVTRFHITRVNVISFTPIICRGCTEPICTVLTTALQHYV